MFNLQGCSLPSQLLQISLWQCPGCRKSLKVKYSFYCLSNVKRFHKVFLLCVKNRFTLELLYFFIISPLISSIINHRHRHRNNTCPSNASTAVDNHRRSQGVTQPWGGHHSYHLSLTGILEIVVRLW